MITTEASNLGLKAGSWPTQIILESHVTGKVIVFNRVKLNKDGRSLLSVEYGPKKREDKKLVKKLLIFND